MSGSASLDLERQLLDHSLAIAPMPALSRVYVALCLAGPSPTEAAPGNEPTGGGYARVPATFARVASPPTVAVNTAAVEFPAATASWGTLGYFEIWTASTGGTRQYWGPLVDPADSTVPLMLDVAAGDIARFSAGTLVIQAAEVATTGGSPWTLGIVNVKDYGARGDGVTDDAAAIQAAATTAAGGILYFPPDGTYLVGAPTYVASDTTVIAHSARIVPSPTITSLPASANPALGSSLGAVLFTNVNWQATALTDHDIRFLGGQFGPLSGARLGCHGIFLRMVERAHVAEARFQLLNDAVAFLACRNTLIENCYAEDLSNCAYDHWDGPADATVRDCEVRGGQSGPSANGVLFNIDSTVTGFSSGVASNVLVDNVRVYGCVNAVQISPIIASHALKNATVSNCYVSGGTGGIICLGVTGGAIRSNTVDACASPVLVSIQTDPSHPSSQISITHNLIQNCTATNQYIQAAGAQMTVAHNRAVNSTSAGHAIMVDDPATVVMPNYLPGYTSGYLINQHPYGGGTTPAMELDADSANNRWNFVQGLKIGTNANAATLSTYEEGTWVPVLRFGGNSVGITYGVQSGTFFRIGKLIYITCDVGLTAKGTSTGTAQIAGLPYAFGGASAGPGMLASYYANLPSITATPAVTVSSNLATLQLTPGGTGLTDANFANSGAIRFNGWYRVT
jgi:hypothetical protein